jgi:hypothetical protein
MVTGLKSRATPDPLTPVLQVAQNVTVVWPSTAVNDPGRVPHRLTTCVP